MVVPPRRRAPATGAVAVAGSVRPKLRGLPCVQLRLAAGVPRRAAAVQAVATDVPKATRRAAAEQPTLARLEVLLAAPNGAAYGDLGLEARPARSSALARGTSLPGVTVLVVQDGLVPVKALVAEVDALRPVGEGALPQGLVPRRVARPPRRRPCSAAPAVGVEALEVYASARPADAVYGLAAVVAQVAVVAVAPREQARALLGARPLRHLAKDVDELRMEAFVVVVSAPTMGASPESAARLVLVIIHPAPDPGLLLLPSGAAVAPGSAPGVALGKAILAVGRQAPSLVLL